MASSLRFVLAGVTLAAAALVIADDLAAPVTMVETGSPARRVLDAVSLRTGVKLQVDAALAREPLVLDVKAMPLSELMKRIAVTLGGEWVEAKPGVHELKYTAARRTDDWNAHIEHRAAAIGKGIDDLIKKADPSATLTAKEFKVILERRKLLNERKKTGDFMDWRAAAAHELKLPLGRAVARLARLLDPRDLAAVDWDERTVYSSNPTRMQRSLGPQAAAVIQALNAENNAINDALVAVPDTPDPHPDGNFIDLPPSYGDSLMRPITRLMLVVSRPTNMASLDLKLYGADSTGKMAVWTEVSVGAVNPPLEGPLLTDKSLIDLSTEAQVYQAPLRANNVGAGKLAKASGGQALEFYLHPERDDPLRFIIGESLIASARALHQQLVASPPDDMFLWTPMVETGKTTVGQFLTMAGYQIVIRNLGGTMLVLPYDRFEALVHRTPREALARYLAAVRSDIFVPLEDNAAFAVAYPYPQFCGLSFWFENALGLQPVIWSRGGFDMNRRALRLWGLLTASQRTRLSGGGAVPLIELTPVQREAAEYLTFRSSTASVIPHPVDDKPYNISANLDFEPTQALPAGLPGTTALTLSSTSRALPFAFPGEQGGFIQALSADALALNRLTVQEGKEGPIAFSKVYRMGSETAATLRLMFAPDLHSDYSLVSASVNMGNPTVGFDELPEDFRKMVETAMQSLLDWRAKHKFDTTPGKNSPPP